MDWENHLGKKSNPKIEKKTVKVKVKWPHVKKNHLRESKLLFKHCLNLFQNYSKNIHTSKPLAFSLHFLFRRDQNHYSNLTSKMMKMCE